MSSTTHMLRGLLERGWTQSEITRRTGIPQPRLSKWARGMVPSGADDALKLKELHDESAAGGVAGTHAGNVAGAAANCSSNLPLEVQSQTVREVAR